MLEDENAMKSAEHSAVSWEAVRGVTHGAKTRMADVLQDPEEATRLMDNTVRTQLEKKCDSNGMELHLVKTIRTGDPGMGGSKEMPHEERFETFSEDELALMECAAIVGEYLA